MSDYYEGGGGGAPPAAASLVARGQNAVERFEAAQPAIEWYQLPPPPPSPSY